MRNVDISFLVLIELVYIVYDDAFGMVVGRIEHTIEGDLFSSF